MELFDVWAELGFLGRYNPALEAVIFPKGSIDCDGIGCVVYVGCYSARQDTLTNARQWHSVKRWARKQNFHITQDGDCEGCFRVRNAVEQSQCWDLKQEQVSKLLSVLGIA